MILKLKRRLLLFFVVYMSYACATNPVTGKKEFMLVSRKQEAQMGAEADPQIRAFFGVYKDQRLQQYIEKEGERMAQISHRSKLDYTFTIVDSPVINAFAVPGGYVYFTRGIMAHFNNEAEFAGVLGHEIGHITARHSARQQSNAMLAQLGLTVGMVVSDRFAQFADIANQGVGLLFLKFGRDAEREADRLGVEYSTRVGFDAYDMATFFRTLQRKEELSGGQAVPSFLSTHPDPGERFENVRELANKWQGKVREESFETGRDDYLRMIDGMVYGEDPRQGYREDNMFYHPVLKFKFPIPADWAFQNTPQQIQMASKEGQAVMMLTFAQANTLDQASQKVLQDYNLELVQSQRVNINGLDAIALVADQQQQQGTIRVLSYLISYDGNIYNIMGISSLQDFDSYSRIFTSVMENFAPLNDPSKINVSPEVIDIKEAPSGGTLAQIFTTLGVPQDRFTELAILNGMDLDDQISQGTLIKVVAR